MKTVSKVNKNKSKKSKLKNFKIMKTIFHIEWLFVRGDKNTLCLFSVYFSFYAKSEIFKAVGIFVLNTLLMQTFFFNNFFLKTEP